jgi:hypothetical protein
MIKMQESKVVLNARGLRTSFNSFLNVHQSTVRSVDAYHLGTRNIVQVIEPCVRNHAENPKFPTEELRTEINMLREAVEARNVHKVYTLREQIENLLSPWQGVQAPIMVGS